MMSDKERGLYDKWTVEHNNDHHHIHDTCPKFVLDLRHDKFAVSAIEAYIEACKEEYPKLARDLQTMIDYESNQI